MTDELFRLRVVLVHDGVKQEVEVVSHDPSELVAHQGGDPGFTRYGGEDVFVEVRTGDVVLIHRDLVEGAAELEEEN